MRVSRSSAMPTQHTCWSWSARLLAMVSTWLETTLLFMFVWIAMLITVEALDIGLRWPSAAVLVAAVAWLSTFTVRALRVSVVVDRSMAIMRVRNVYRSHSVTIGSIAGCRIRGPGQFWRGGWGMWAPVIVLVDRAGREVPITASATDRRVRRSEISAFLRAAGVPGVPTDDAYVRAIARSVRRSQRLTSVDAIRLSTHARRAPSPSRSRGHPLVRVILSRCSFVSWSAQTGSPTRSSPACSPRPDCFTSAAH